MPETADNTASQSSLRCGDRITDPRLRAGRRRILRHAALRGAATGLWIALPLSALIWKLTAPEPLALFRSIGLLGLGALFCAVHQRYKAGASWPRIWDATLGAPALVETVVYCQQQNHQNPWHESMRARSAQLPLPPAPQLYRHVPFASPLPALILTMIALLIGSLTPYDQDPVAELTSPESSDLVTTTSPTQETSQPSTPISSPAILRGRENAALALAGREQLSPLAQHLRHGSPIPDAPVDLLARDRRALETALGRLVDTDPRRLSLEPWLGPDRPVRGNSLIPISQLPAAGPVIAQETGTGQISGAPAEPQNNGGQDRPNRLQTASPAPPGVSAGVSAGVSGADATLRLEGQTVAVGETNRETRKPIQKDSSSSWDRVRDDPRLDPRWIEVIDRYRDLLRRKEPDGGR